MLFCRKYYKIFNTIIYQKIVDKHITTKVITSKARILYYFVITENCRLSKDWYNTSRDTNKNYKKITNDKIKINWQF